MAVSLARARTSDSVSNRNSETMGAKDSSDATAMVSKALRSSVGGKKYPADDTELLGAATGVMALAPRLTASLTCAWALSRERGVVSGPNVVAGSRPWPGVRSVCMRAVSSSTTLS